MSPSPPADSTTPHFTGEIVYLFAFDIAQELGRGSITELLGQKMQQYCLDSTRRTPRHLLSFRPAMIRLPKQERVGPHGLIQIQREVKLLSIGAVSIRVLVPFSVARLSDLVPYHDLQFGELPLHEEVRQLAEAIRTELAPHIIRPVDRLADEEAYTVFCLRGPLAATQGAALRAEAWLDTNRREIAAVLTQEPGDPRLSRQEALESTSRYLSYYEDDLAVIDWDAALLVDAPAEWEETLYVLELANVQLAELEAYDRVLDTTLDNTYRALSKAVRGRRQLVKELRELQIDLTRFNDEISNITKFFGDWHIARVYAAVSDRFHLADWHRSVEAKLKTVAELHELVKHDQTNRWMMILEVTIVLLFIIDLGILFFGWKH